MPSTTGSWLKWTKPGTACGCTTEPGRARGLRDIAAQGRTLLNGKLKAFDPYGFKDPNIARLLPFWRKIFAGLKREPRFVVANRNPISVAQSLLKWDGIGAERSYLLWLVHKLSAL